MTQGLSGTLYAGVWDVGIADTKAQGTGGGTFTLGADRTRVLNTVLFDPAPLIVSLSSNQLILQAGTYQMLGFAPACAVDSHQAFLKNVTAVSTLVTGSSSYAANASAAQTVSILMGQFTVAGGQFLELQHRSSNTFASNGFGVPLNARTEVYTQLFFRRVK